MSRPLTAPLEILCCHFKSGCPARPISECGSCTRQRSKLRGHTLWSNLTQWLYFVLLFFQLQGPRRLQSARTAPPRGHSRAAPPRSGRPRDELLRPRGLSRGPLAALIGSETSTSGPRPRGPFLLPGRSQREGQPLPGGDPCPRPGRALRGSQVGPGSPGCPSSAPALAGGPRVRAGCPGARVRRGGAGGAGQRPLTGCPRPRPPAFRGRRDNRSSGSGGGRASPAPPPGRTARQAAAARPCSFPRLPAGGEGPARPPPARRRVSGAGAAPPARRSPAAVRARAASGRDYAKMVLQARNKHREAAPKPPQPPRASQSPLRGAPDVGAGEPGPERAPSSPRRKGAAGRKGPRAEPATPLAGGGLGGRLAAGLRGALGLRLSGRGRTWTTLLLGEQPSARAPPGRGTLRRGRPSPLPLRSPPASAPPSPAGRSLPVRSPLRLFLGHPYLFLPSPSPRLSLRRSLPTCSLSLL